MALTDKERDFLINLVKGLTSLVMVGRENKAVKILNEQKKKKKSEPKKEVKKKTFDVETYRKYFNTKTTDMNAIMKKFLNLSSGTNPPTDYGRYKAPMGG